MTTEDVARWSDDRWPRAKANTKKSLFQLGSHTVILLVQVDCAYWVLSGLHRVRLSEICRLSECLVFPQKSPQGSSQQGGGAEGFEPIIHPLIGPK